MISDTPEYSAFKYVFIDFAVPNIIDHLNW